MPVVKFIQRLDLDQKNLINGQTLDNEEDGRSKDVRRGKDIKHRVESAIEEMVFNTSGKIKVLFPLKPLVQLSNW